MNWWLIVYPVIHLYVSQVSKSTRTWTMHSKKMLLCYITKLLFSMGFLLLFFFFFVIFNLCYLFWQTGSKMVSCSLQFDESSDDDLEKLMTPSSKRKLDLSHVSHMSHMSIASPMQEYVSPCFQVRQQQITSLFYVPWIISLKDRHPTVRNFKKNHTLKNISKETIG